MSLTLHLCHQILIESMLPSWVMISLLEGSHPMSATSSHTHPSCPSSSHIVFISHNLHTLSLVSCQLMRDSSMPSFDRSVPVDENTLFGNLIYKRISTLDPIAVSDRCPRIWQWNYTIGSCSDDSSSVQLHHIHSYSLDCTRYLGTHHFHRWTPSHWLIGYINA